MSEELNAAPTTTFWVVGGAALIWNLLGLLIYYMQVTATPDSLAAVYNDAEIAFITATPAWATSAYAIAVVTGVGGGLFLLLRKSWAVPMFMISLVGIIVQNGYAFLLAGGLEVWGMQALVLPTIVAVIAVALIWYSRGAKSRGWLG